MTTNTLADGSFSFTVHLKPGRWLLTMVGEGPTGNKTQPVSRQVNVQYTGVNVLIQVSGGDASMYVVRDGEVDYRWQPEPDGWSTTVAAKTYVCVTTREPDNVLITFNGRSYGSISSLGGDHVYIDSRGPRSVDSC